jgi:hypothetical protein
MQKGAKKLFGLARTKIRLAEEADTVETKPKPLPLVRRLLGKEISSVGEAKELVEELRRTLDFSDRKAVASAVFALFDIIEGVKYRFEPPEYCTLIAKEKLGELVADAEEAEKKVDLLIMTEEPAAEGLFLGEDAPAGAAHLGRVVSNAALLLDVLFQRDGDARRLRVRGGRKTLIAEALIQALKEYGAEEILTSSAK